MNTKNTKVLSLILLSPLFIPALARAAAISVSPAKIELSGTLSKPSVTRLVVKNPGEAAMLFDVYPDSFQPMIKAMPSSFVLESNEKREVTISAAAKNEGIIQTNISVVAEPLSELVLNARTGVKIPLTLTVINESALLASLSSYFDN